MKVIHVHNNQRHQVRSAALLALAIIQIADCAADQTPPEIRVVPLKESASIAADAVLTPQNVTNPADTKLQEPMIKLNAILGAAVSRNQNNQSATGGMSLSEERWTSIEDLRAQAGSDVEVKGLELDGLPRQIKGAILEKAAESAGEPQSEQDRRTALNFLENRRKLLGVEKPAKELSLVRETKDELGRRHLRFQQTYRGLPVWPAEAVVHIDPLGNVDAFDSVHIRTPRNNTGKPVLDRASALARARLAIPGHPGSEPDSAGLIYYTTGRGNPILAWKMEIPVSTGGDWLVVIDAVNGATLAAYNQVREAAASGSGTDLLGVTRPLQLWASDGLWWMVDASKPSFDAGSTPPKQGRGVIQVWDARNLPNSSSPWDYPDPTFYFVNSANANSGWVPDAVSAAFNLSLTYDYFRERHGRNAIDGQGGSMTAIVRYGAGFQNAFWSSSNKKMYFGTAEPYAAALDVIAHELTHGVTDYSANFVGKGQPGALNEAFSDIFGESVEARSVGQNDWLMGSVLHNAIRDLKTPGRLGDPASMSEFQVLAEDAAHDWGGVHTNSTIIGHAYYLLAAGLNGAIGLADAERIFYRALTVHLLQNSQFVDARRAAILSAEEIFGAGSVQARRTAEAFDAVELADGPATPAPAPVPTVNAADSTLCVYYNSSIEDWRLCRRETALQDPAQGTTIAKSVSIDPDKRSAVTGDGAIALFISADHDACVVLTADASSAQCVGKPGSYATLTISPSGNYLAGILLDTNGDSMNQLVVVDRNSGNTRTFTLKAPVHDGPDVIIDHADALTFTADGRYLMFDALNRYALEDGSKTASWSIYALDLASERFMTVVPVVEGYDIGFPSAAHTRTDRLLFEAMKQSNQVTTVFAANLSNGKVTAVNQVSDRFSAPVYTGDDRGVVHSRSDDTSTGSSLWLQPLAADFTTPAGTATKWLSDADFGVIYRRGDFGGGEKWNMILTTTKSGNGRITSSPTGIDCGSDCEQAYPANTLVTLTAKADNGFQFARWEGCDSVAGQVCTVTMNDGRTVKANFSSGSASPGTPGTPNTPGTPAESKHYLGIYFGMDYVKGAPKGPISVTSNPASINCALKYQKDVNGWRCSGTAGGTLIDNTLVTLSIAEGTGIALDTSNLPCISSTPQSCTLYSGPNAGQLKLGLAYTAKTLQVAVEGAGTVGGAGLRCTSDCVKNYSQGKIRSLTLRAKPAKGWSLAGWEGCDSSSGKVCKISLADPRGIRAIFQQL